MKTGTVIAVVGLVGAAGAIGYVLYKRKTGSAAIAQAQQSGADSSTASLVTSPTASIIPSLEGKAYRLPDGKIYLVKGGVLRLMANVDVLQRELGTRRYETLIDAGVLTNVNSLPTSLTVGLPLNGINLVKRVQGDIAPALARTTASEANSAHCMNLNF